MRELAAVPLADVRVLRLSVPESLELDLAEPGRCVNG